MLIPPLFLKENIGVIWCLVLGLLQFSVNTHSFSDIQHYGIAYYFYAWSPKFKYLPPDPFFSRFTNSPTFTFVFGDLSGTSNSTCPNLTTCSLLNLLCLFSSPQLKAVPSSQVPRPSNLVSSLSFLFLFFTSHIHYIWKSWNILRSRWLGEILLSLKLSLRLEPLSFLCWMIPISSLVSLLLPCPLTISGAALVILGKHR